VQTVFYEQMTSQ